jgi:hypothetical protein
MPDVFLLWHISHGVYFDGTPTHHRDETGELLIDEQEGDEPKLLGVYSTRALAEDRIRRCADVPGFRSEPDCFDISPFTVDADEWPEGFTRHGLADEWLPDEPVT